jgi:ABC-type nitrate/sulfonate/bicarbonate transport system ATPase subunit
MSMLEFVDVCFDYEQKKVLDHFSLSLKKGEIVAIMGASGIGKSTVLNLAAGLREPLSGKVECDANKISYAFQDARLFPWMTVLENVNAVLSAKDASVSRAMEALRLVSLENSASLYPHELSGGMKSRVSLARAIAYSGDLYLLDEPFSALDEQLRQSIATALRNHIRSQNASALLVTHQQSDAELMADRIVYF